ncbi:IS3 family transposase [Streptomyces sp. NPDC005529]|uniref:IS3 family transposase n=1 Tax=unclassified Streptomyces TaxID=2593676 RepID=UPI0033B254FA
MGRARCIERCPPGSGSGPGKRSGRKAGTPPRADFHGPSTALKVAYIDQHKQEFGVQPICDVLKDTDAEIAPSTYYAARTRPESARIARDRELTEEIRVIHAGNYGVYGARKIHAALRRAGRSVARCTIERLMRAAGLRGVTRDKSPRTTGPAPETDRPRDLVAAGTGPATAENSNSGGRQLSSELARTVVCLSGCLLGRGGWVRFL